MSEQIAEQSPEGPAERQVREVLDRGWKSVSIEQRGPDGTEVLMVLLFAVCPVCKCVVALPTDEHHFTEEHAGYHIEQARALDVVSR